MSDPTPPAADEPSPVLDAATRRTLDRFRLVLGGSTLAMLALSWPLWLATGSYPRVPLLAGVPEVTGQASWLPFLALLVGVIGGAVGLGARRGELWRPPLGFGLALLAYLIACDQHRLQPWAYQYLLVGLALLALPEARALGFARFFVIILYFHSGVSKLDVSFCRELGPTFLRAALGPLRIDPGDWPERVRMAAVLGMPLWELAVAVGLGFGRTRRIALIAATAMHLALIAILGPWGLDHSTIVLVWNGALLVENWILFGSIPPSEAPARSSAGSGLVAWIFIAAALLPFGERSGLWDAWPSFALYASHVGRADVWVHEADVARLPGEIRGHFRATGRGEWRLLDQTGWSRSVRGVPAYPQARYGVGLAESIAGQGGGQIRIGVDLWSPADRWTGRRDRVELRGIEAIRRQAGSYRLNAHPVVDRPLARPVLAR